MFEQPRRAFVRNPRRRAGAASAAAIALCLLTACTHGPNLNADASTELTNPHEIPAHWITLREPATHEVVVVVNNNGFWGNHAGMFAGPRLTDPAGSYHFYRSKVIGWTHPTLADYIAFQSADGVNIESYRFTVSAEDFATIDARMATADRAAPLYCATAVQNAVAGVGPFRSIKAAGWITPAALAEHLRPLTRGDDAPGHCELPDGSACRGSD